MEYELYHYGKKGMKWGVRRYQNKDGSLTEAGKKRYGYDTRTNSKAYKGRQGQVDEIDVRRWVKEDTSASKKLVEETTQMTRNLKTTNDAMMRNKPKNQMDLSKMTDKEMRDQINRALLEKQYNDIFAPDNVSKGQRYASQFLETAGNILAVGGTALGIALSVMEIKEKLG